MSSPAFVARALLPCLAMKTDDTFTRKLCVALIASALAARGGSAQELAPPNLPPGWITPVPVGFLTEPALLRKLVRTSESLAADEEGTADGFYVETANMITGEGWISAGPGYRRHLPGGRLRLDVSAAVSWNLYNVVQANVELPHLARERVTIGAQVLHQDYLQVDYFGLGNDSRASDLSGYRFTNSDVMEYATAHATTWLTVSGRFGGIPTPRL